MLKREGLETKEERGNRIFPVTDRAVDVRDALLRELNKYNVKIITNSKAIDLIVNDSKIIGVKYENLIDNSENKIEADKVILATGGKSYPLTGSSGDG